MDFQHELKIANYKVYLKRKLGCGAFGDIFYGVNSKTNEEVAVKIESTKLKNLQLQNETRILKYLQGGCGIPTVYHYMSTPYYNFMICELLGPSLEDLHAFSKRSYDLKTVLLLAEQMVRKPFM